MSNLNPIYGARTSQECDQEAWRRVCEAYEIISERRSEVGDAGTVEDIFVVIEECKLLFGDPNKAQPKLRGAR